MLSGDPTIHVILARAIHQVTDFSITVLNIHGVFLFWNKGATNLDGYEANEIIGKPLSTLHPSIEQKEKLSENLLSTAAKEGRAKHIGKRLKKNGTIYWANVVLNAIFDEAGKHIGYIRIARELRAGEIE
jgi:PAS domain S-box-containing protein